LFFSLFQILLQKVSLKTTFWEAFMEFIAVALGFFVHTNLSGPLMNRLFYSESMLDFGVSKNPIVVIIFPTAMLMLRLLVAAYTKLAKAKSG